MDNSASDFDMVAEHALTMRETTKDQEMEENKNNEIVEREKEDNEDIDELDNMEKSNKDKMYNEENVSNDMYDNDVEEMQTLNIYEMKEGAISMMGKMALKLPSPTQFDGCYPQFNEWSGEVKAYLGVHNVNIEDIMDKCTTSVTVIVFGDIQDKHTAAEVNRLNTTCPQAVNDGEDGYDDYMDMRDNIRKMRGDIISFSQTLNYVLRRATKPGSEAHSIITRVMRQSNGFEFLRQLQLRFAGGHRAQQFLFLRTIMQPNWPSDTKQFTRQYYEWLEDINRYEAENGHGSITGDRSRDDRHSGQ
eukprot:102160-Amphidinium_carterae.1